MGLARVCATLTLELGKTRSDLRKLMAPFKPCDSHDWKVLDEMLGHSAHGKFWREVLKEFRFQLSQVEAEHKEHE